MDEIEKAREEALLLVAEIAETSDHNVPVLLLGLKGILESCPKGSAQEYKLEMICGRMILCMCSVWRDVKHELLKNFRAVIDSISWLLSCYRSLAIRVLQSKRVMQLLMCEEPEICLFIISFIQSLVKANREILKVLSDLQLSSLMDELVYKISAVQDSSIARSSIKLVLFLTSLHYPIVELLSSKRYRGLKAYLSKWNGRGFDWDVKRLVSLLETESATQAEAMKFSRAAALIQASFRGYRDRQNLKKAHRGITLLPTTIQRTTNPKNKSTTCQENKGGKEHVTELKRRASFRSSLNKQLNIIDSLPARGVDKYLQESQVQAVARIQAGFRGMKTRREFAQKKEQAMKFSAAVLIQRQFRRYLKRRKHLKKTPLKLAPPV